MILRLAHVVAAVDDLPAARAFYVDLLGFVVHASDDRQLLLRGAEEFDAWSLALHAAPRAGLLRSGFRVGAPEDLDELEAIQRRLDLPARRLPAGHEPGLGETLRTTTPDGHVVDFVHTIEEIDPYASGELRLPMRAGTLGAGIPPARLDHVSLRVPDLGVALDHWTGPLGFSVSERWVGDDGQPRIAWVRRTPRSHDVALGVSPEAAFHHVAYAVSDAAALLRAADLLGDAGLHEQLEWGPSRHGATNALALYVRDPAGLRLELYTGDYWRDLDRPPLTWSGDGYRRQGHSWWGWPAPERFLETMPLLTEEGA